MSRAKRSRSVRSSHLFLALIGLFTVLVGLYLLFFYNVTHYERAVAAVEAVANIKPSVPVLDTEAYDQKMLSIANCPPPKVVPIKNATSSTAATSTLVAQPCDWPAKTVYPNAGALLPFNRILAYYGNFYSKGMGVLGEYPEAELIAKLHAAVAEWKQADPQTPVVPAIEYIDVTAQGSAGKDGKYRLRMPDSQIDKALELAQKVDGIVILDIQVGLSSVQDEVPLIDSYLARPNVHLALDPEFDMPGSIPPGRVIGTMDATTINWAIDHLSAIVREHNLPPKILVIHRFTQDMVTNYQNIKPTPEVQVVMQMDGWGSWMRKVNTYNHVVAPEPVQFTGFKIFYKNDLKEDPPRLMMPSEVLKLTPQPIFIQYQ